MWPEECLLPQSEIIIRDLRQDGAVQLLEQVYRFSKDGKTAETQVVLGLLVSENGYPLSYSLFNGAQFEGRTMIPLVDDFIQRYDIKDFVLVADSGLMSKKNIELLRKAG